MTKLAIVLGLVAVGFASGSLWSTTSRLREAWPYDKLTQKSDVVLIAGFESSTETDDPVTEKQLKSLEDRLIGVVTTLKVEAVLKGKVGGKSIYLYHYKFRQGAEPR